MSRTKHFGRATVAVGALIWMALIGLGARTLLTYENTAGPEAAAPSRWPSGTTISRPPGEFTLVMFAHPDCPCTSASLTELEILMTRLQGRLAARVALRKPAAREEEVRTSSIWRRAAGIPGVSVSFDSDGAEVARFDAKVSGQALLYDPAGRLVFSGGITDSRGHEGDNPGVDAVLLRVKGGEAPFHAPVFGCSLEDPDEERLQNSAWKKL